MQRRAREGFILVAVLGVLALLAGLVGAVSVLVRSAVDSARIVSDDLSLEGLVSVPKSRPDQAGRTDATLHLHCSAASARKVRSVRREMRWRSTLKVL